MKLKIMLLLICAAMSSCIEEKDLNEEEHLVEYRVYSNTKGALISLSQYDLKIKDYWDKKYVTKGYFAQIVARCDDPTVLITAEIYVDGKLKAKGQENGYLDINYRIKGEGY